MEYLSELWIILLKWFYKMSSMFEVSVEMDEVPVSLEDDEDGFDDIDGALMLPYRRGQSFL